MADEHHEKHKSSGNAYLFVILLPLSLMSLGVVVLASVKHKEKQQMKQRENETIRRLDAELPPMMYGKVDDLECKGHEGETCCICLDGLEGNIVRKLHCGHVLHQYCFDRWCLRSSDSRRSGNLDEKRPEETL